MRVCPTSRMHGMLRPRGRFGRTGEQEQEHDVPLCNESVPSAWTF